MKKIVIVSFVSCFSFFIGTHGFETPNPKAPFTSKIDFAFSLDKAMATTEENAAEWAKGLWEFIAGASGADENTYVYGWAKSMMVNFSDAMVSVGYPNCDAFPITGFDKYPDNTDVTMNYFAGDKTIPGGTYWKDPAVTYQKKLVADLNGTNFLEIQYNCDDLVPNVYLKYDFSAFEGRARILEMYAQHDVVTNQVTIELQTVCTETVLESCGTKQTTAMLMNTSDGNEYKIIGTRIDSDGGVDEVKRLSVHGIKSGKLVDIHMMDISDKTNSDTLDPVANSATVDAFCVDFNQATYVPVNGDAACSGLSLSADVDLPFSASDSFGRLTLDAATVDSIDISF